MSPAPVNAAFFGSDPIGLPILEYGLSHPRLNWSCIFTQPDRARGRGRQVVANAIKSFAGEHGIPVYQPAKPDAATTQIMEKAGVRIGFVLAYGHILRREHLEAPAQGMWNFHGSALPALRGASPIETALAEGLSQTAMTLMRMVLKMDAGPILDQEPVDILPDESAPDLRERMGYASLPLLERQLDPLLSGQARPREQDLSGVSYCRKLEKTDGLLDFSLPAVVLKNRMRACVPWPGSAFLLEDGTPIKVGRARALKGGTGMVPGLVRLAPENDAVEITCGEGILSCHELQRPGGRMLPAADFLRGFPLESGTKLAIIPSKPWEQSEPFPHNPPAR